MSYQSAGQRRGTENSGILAKPSCQQVQIGSCAGTTTLQQFRFEGRPHQRQAGADPAAEDHLTGIEQRYDTGQRLTEQPSGLREGGLC